MDTCTPRRYTYCHGRTYVNSRVALLTPAARPYSTSTRLLSTARATRRVWSAAGVLRLGSDGSRGCVVCTNKYGKLCCATSSGYTVI